jgi:hypothetical protein
MDMRSRLLCIKTKFAIREPIHRTTYRVTDSQPTIPKQQDQGAKPANIRLPGRRAFVAPFCNRG